MIVDNGFLNFLSKGFPFKSSDFGALFQRLHKMLYVSIGLNPGSSDLAMKESSFLSNI